MEAESAVMEPQANGHLAPPEAEQAGTVPPLPPTPLPGGL